MVRWGELLCKVTGKPFHPMRRDGAVVCSECGEVFIRDAAERSGPSMPLRCRATKREFYPYKTTAGGKVVLRCSECHEVIYEEKASA